MTNDAAFRTKLAKILEMLTSSHEGERLAAVEKANRELARRKLTWTELICEQPAAPATAPAEWQPEPRQPATAEDRDFMDRARQILRGPFYGALSTNEQRFILQMATAWDRALSEKQRAYIASLRRKTERMAKEAA